MEDEKPLIDGAGFLLPDVNYTDLELRILKFYEQEQERKMSDEWAQCKRCGFTLPCEWVSHKLCSACWQAQMVLLLEGQSIKEFVRAVWDRLVGHPQVLTLKHLKKVVVKRVVAEESFHLQDLKSELAFCGTGYSDFHDVLLSAIDIREGC